MTSELLQVVKRANVLLLGGLLLGISSVANAAFVTNLSDVQIQNVLENYFPVNEYATFARVSLHKPQVRLQNNEKIVLIAPVLANISGGEIRRGHATIQVELAYKPHTGGLYFSHPTIQQFEVPGADKQMLKDLREIVGSMAQSSLLLVRIYSVKVHDLNHSLSKSTLKSSEIVDGRLQLEFGFN